MALVQSGYVLSVTLVDASIVNTSTLTFELEAADETAALAARTAILAALANVTDAVVKSTSLTLRHIEDALVGPAAGVQVENRATIVLQLASSPLKKATITIPAASPGVFIAPTGPGMNTVDSSPSNTDVQTYIDIWRETGALASLSDGEYVADAASIVSGKRTHRANSNG